MEAGQETQSFRIRTGLAELSKAGTRGHALPAERKGSSMLRSKWVSRLAVMVAFSSFLAGCRDTGTLVPAVYQSAMLTCDCKGTTSSLPLAVRFKVEPGAIGKGFWVKTPSGCARKTMTAADVDIEFEDCATPFGGEFATNRVAPDDAEKLIRLGQSCLEPQLLPKCIAVTPAPGGSGLIPVGATSFAAKCAQFCGAPTFGPTDVTYCDMTVFETTGFGRCLKGQDTVSMRTTAQCANPTGGPSVLDVTSCAPISDKDPVSAIVYLAGSSSVTISALDEKGVVVESTNTKVSGFLAFDAETCPSGSCPLNLLRVSLKVADFSLRGEGMKDVALGRDEGIAGTLSDTGSVRLVPQGTNIAIRGTLARDGIAREGTAPLSGPVVGRLDPTTGELNLRLILTSSQLAARIDATLKGVVQNRTPKPGFDLAPTTECSTHGGALLAVDASPTTDADGDVRRYEWYVDDTPAGDGRTDTLFVPSGSHQITLRVIDAAFNHARITKTTTVVDTMPPVIEDFLYQGPACLWPPNHDYAVLDVSRDFTALVHDSCDPNPTFTIEDAVSDQPDDGLGDGNTAADIVRHPSHVCLRMERAGNVLAGREYAVSLVARDSAGNASDPTVTIRVPHDRADKSCGKVQQVQGVDEDSPACRPAVAVDLLSAEALDTSSAGAANPSTTLTSPSAGCSAVPGTLSLVVGALAVLLRRRNRR